MTDATTKPTTDPAPATADPAPAVGQAEAPVFDAERRATELAILDALRAVVDPEIGMNVVELALIKQIILGPELTEVKMILTTPFCPYGPMLINQIQTAAETAAEMPVKVTVLPDRWEPPPWLR